KIEIIKIYDINNNYLCETLVDDDQYYKLKKYPLCKIDNYISIHVDKKNLRLSRYLMNCYDPELQVDHKKGNTMDNRIRKLRIVDSKGNAQNKHFFDENGNQHTGISFYKDHNYWKATINKITLGCYPTFDEACIVR